MDPRCKIAILMGADRTRTRTSTSSNRWSWCRWTRQGSRVVRPLTVFGYDDAPHGHAEVLFENVRVPASNILLGEGRGFEIAQGRLGPGRIHHCMRSIGLAERALETLCRRALSREPFGRTVAEHGVARHWIAESRMRDRPGAPAHPEGRPHDGRGRQQGRPRRDRHDQGGGAERGAARSSIGRSRFAAEPESTRISTLPMRMRAPAFCAWPTGRTKCTARPSPSSNSPSTHRGRSMPTRYDEALRSC